LEVTVKKKTQKKHANSGLTIDNPDLVHLLSIGLQGMEGCCDLKPPHGEEQPLPPTASKCKIVITGLKKVH